MAQHGSAQPGDVIAFGRFRLLPSQHLLLEGDQPVLLGSRALAILLALVRQAGEVVGKAELIAIVWPSTFVDETNLRVHVTALRKALRDGEDGNRYIVTIPGRGYRFVAPVAAAAAAPEVPPPAAAVTAPQGGLPLSMTQIIGRDGVIAALSTLLRERRFVTLVGTGGIGKTTVAIAVARALAAANRDGVSFLDLSPISDPALLARALAAALGLAVAADNPLPDVIALLKHKQMLLVLDSCEHVIEAAAATAEELFNAAPGVQILATSREPLRAAGERVHRLAPLESPSASAGLTAAAALTYPSVQLFVERAAASLDDFRLSDADAPVVAEICRRLDGIALAIELAAGRVAAFGLRDLAARLDDRFRLLMSGRRTALPRHQTLAATLDWSHSLLPEAERKLLRHLAVFAGDFTLEAAIAVACDLPAGEVIDHLADLVAKSLVAADLRSGRAKYRLLDTTRLYALDKLRDSGEWPQAAQRHAALFQAFFARAEAQLDTRPQAEWLGLFGSQIDNLRAALDWAFSPQGDATTGVALTLAVVPLWVELSLMAECRNWADRALASLGSDASAAALRARMQLTAALGWSRMFGAGPGRETGAAWSQTLALAEQLGDSDYESRALWGLWLDCLNNGAMPQALALARRFESTVAGSSDAIDRLMAERMLATSLHYLGDQSMARAHIERMLRRYAPPSRRSQIVRFQLDQRVAARYFQARIVWLQGCSDAALRIAEDGIAEAQALGHALLLGSALGQGGCPLALFTGDLEVAGRYAAMLREHAERHALHQWLLWVRCFEALLSVRRGDTEAGLLAMRSGLAAAGASRLLPRYLPLLGEFAGCLGESGAVAEGLATVAAALERCERSGEQWYGAELLRIEGELLLRAGAPDAMAAAEARFRQALDLAGRQGALAWELRAATSLARLHILQGSGDQVLRHLSAVLGRFSEGFATADLCAARQMLARPA
jgi:predicted ATPase/DNA-binding winged helix-turn-helix (wHTH) protein